MSHANEVRRITSARRFPVASVPGPGITNGNSPAHRQSARLFAWWPPDPGAPRAAFPHGLAAKGNVTLGCDSHPDLAELVKRSAGLAENPAFRDRRRSASRSVFRVCSPPDLLARKG